ncbi:MAG: DUF1214 domain-containing protein [Methyloceanibacter sp.]
MFAANLLKWLGLAPSAASRPAPIGQDVRPGQSSAEFPLGPAPGTRLTSDFVREIGRFAYVWAWPMVNIFNRYSAFKRVKRPRLLGGIAPIAPINHLCMLHNYVDPRQRYITCPSQDLVYGFGMLDFGREPVVVQVPEFGSRFWVYQATDLRTDGFADLGPMYGTKPGFYLLAGPDWRGKVPAEIAATFHARTTIGTIIPRVFQEDDRNDNLALQPVLQQIMAYPLSEFDGMMKSRDWSEVGSIPWIKLGDEEWTWVKPTSFFEVLPSALAAARPLSGEEALYALVRSILDAANTDRAFRKVLKDAAAEADATLVAPLLQFRNFGVPLPHHWTTVVNSAEFGTDYFTRTAVARSNTFINRPRETRYFYQDLDRTGARLNGAKPYTVTFGKHELPPVKGFWSLTLYNKQHFFAPNEINRFSVGTKSRQLSFAADGSLTIYVQKERPGEERVANWLPSPADDFSLYIRAYWPLAPIAGGRWTPPPVVPVG